MKYLIFGQEKHSVQSHKTFDGSFLICWKIEYLWFWLIQKYAFNTLQCSEIEGRLGA